jgi:hypothetical protein
VSNIEGKATIMGGEFPVERRTKRTRKVATRTCIDCVYWEIDFGTPAWSDVTPGARWSSECLKRHWHLDGWNTSREDFRKAVRTAMGCGDFLARAQP